MTQGKRSTRWIRSAGLLALTVLAGCGTPGGARPAGPAQPHPHPQPAPVPSSAQQQARRHTQADVRFMHGMLAHHAQALEMTSLVPGRAAREELRLLAERITVSQRDEIAQMQRWLRARGEPVPDARAHHAAEGHAMPGMATPEEMAALAALTGPAFDRRFLELMIRHHEGALVMVGELFASPGAAQESEMYQIASDVDADQRAEIARMRMLLGGPLSRTPQR